MSTIVSTVLDAVGQTPLVRLRRLAERPDVEILAKLDFLNPGGSTKDRPLVRMVEEAELKGDLKPGANQGLPHHRPEARVVVHNEHSGRRGRGSGSGNSFICYFLTLLR